MYRFATPPKMRCGRKRITMMLYFESLAGTQVPEEYNLNTNMAKVVDKMLSDELLKDISAQLTDKYDTYINCTHLNVLPCNTEVFKHASVKAKNRDSALQNNQEKKRDLHINVLELHAALPSIQSLCQKLRHCHLCIELNELHNTTTVA